jgi:hypothetical protein
MFSEIPKSHLEEVGERLLQVVQDHANDETPTMELIAEVSWALGLYVRLDFVPKEKNNDL